MKDHEDMRLMRNMKCQGNVQEGGLTNPSAFLGMGRLSEYLRDSSDQANYRYECAIQ